MRNSAKVASIPAKETPPPFRTPLIVTDLSEPAQETVDTKTIFWRAADRMEQQSCLVGMQAFATTVKHAVEPVSVRPTNAYGEELQRRS
jgi:hypothetical protein